MKRFSIVAVITIILFLPDPGFPGTDSWTGNINYFIGLKNPYKINEWDYSDNSVESGILIDFRRQEWFANIAVDYMHSIYHDDVETGEWNIGFRKLLQDPIQWTPFFGAGISILSAEIDFQGRSDSDTGVGYWVDIGWYWNFFTHLNFAWEARYTSTEVTLLNKNGDVGGWRWGLLLGYHF